MVGIRNGAPSRVWARRGGDISRRGKMLYTHTPARRNPPKFDKPVWNSRERELAGAAESQCHATRRLAPRHAGRPSMAPVRKSITRKWGCNGCRNHTSRGQITWMFPGPGEWVFAGVRAGPAFLGMGEGA